MNIIVSDNNGHYHFRPDNTLTKGSGEYYLPASIEYIEIIPAIAIRIDRAAKRLSGQFAHRYISKYLYGLLIYPQAKGQYLSSGCQEKPSTQKSLKDISSLQTVLETTLDNTTYTSEDLIHLEEVGQQESIISLTIDNHLYLYKIPPSALLKEKIYEFIERVTIHSSLKTGDLLFLELEPETAKQIIQTQQGADISLSIEKIEMLRVKIR